MGKAEAIKAGSAYVELSADEKALIKGLDKAGSAIKSFGKTVAVFGTAVSAAGMGVEVGLLGAVYSAVSLGSELSDMSDRTGVAVEDLSALGYAAQLSGASLEDVQAALRKQSRLMVNDSVESRKAVDDLGLSFDELRKMSGGDRFKAIGKALNDISNGEERAGKAQAVWGKGAMTLLPMLKDLDELLAKQKKLGIGVTKEDAQKAEALGDAFDDLKLSVKQVVLEVGFALVPVVRAFVDYVQPFVTRVVFWVKANRDLAKTIALVAAGLVVAGGIITAVGFTIAAIGTGFTVAAAVASGLGVAIAFLATPLGAVVVGLAGALVLAGALSYAFGSLLYQVVKNTDAFRIFVGYLGTVGAYASAIFEGVSNAIKGGDIQLAIDILIGGMKVAWVDFRNWFVEIWDGMANKVRSVLSDMLQATAAAVSQVNQAQGDRLFNAGAKIGGKQRTAKIDNSDNIEELQTNLAIARFEAFVADQARTKDIQPDFSNDFKVGQAGTFNAAAVSGLFGGGGTIGDRQLDQQKQANQLLQQLLQICRERLGNVVAG